MTRRHLGLVSFSAVALFTPAAQADDGPRMLFGHPVNEPRALTEAERAGLAAGLAAALDERGLVLIDRQVLPKRVLTDEVYIPPGVPEGAWDLPPHRTTIFLNFFGGPMSSGTNASEMESPCIQGNVNYPGYGGTEQKALSIIQVFENAAAPFGVRIAYEDFPPKHLPYSQVMMGGDPGIIGLPQGVLGVACNLDCGDQWWRDTTFAFTEETNDVNILGTTALQEAAHAWGLDHIDGENNLMYPYATPGIKVWADTCTDYNPATGQIGCTFTHDKFCGGGQQNDVAELTAYFGVNTPDTIPPTVVMTSPADGSEWHAGDMVHVEVQVSDDHEGYGWRLMIPELNQEAPIYDGTTSWNLQPPMGAFTIRVEAIDHDRNIGFAEAKIYVDVEPEPEPAGTETGDVESETGTQPTTGAGGSSSGDVEPGSTGGGGGEEGDSDGGSASLPITGDDPDEMSDDKGCGCRTDATAPVWLLAFAAVGVRRRRR